MEEIKQKVQDLELALNYVCYDADLIPKLQTVWQKLELLQEVVNKKCNIPHVSVRSEQSNCVHCYEHILTVKTLKYKCKNCGDEKWEQLD